jgi:hypothetical protein
MELIINIPDEEYNKIKEWEDNITGYQTSLMLYRAVRNGITLDSLKNKFWHGDLIPNKDMYHISEIMCIIDSFKDDEVD